MKILDGHLLNLLPTTISTMILGYFCVKTLDMILGLLKTWKKNNYKSRIMRDGLVRWIAELVAIVLVIGIDYIIGLNYYLTGLVLGLFIYKEIGSIVENLKECGVELPNQVDKAIEVFNPNKEEDKHQ